MVKKFLDWTEKICFSLMVLLFAVMVLSIFLQVVLRFVFKSGNAWSEELARYTFAWMVLLGSAVAARRGRHMRIDFIINMFPAVLKSILGFLLNILLLAFLIVLTQYGFNLVFMTMKQHSTGLNIPMAWAYLCIPFGGILMIIYTLESILNEFTKENSIFSEYIHGKRREAK